MSRSAGSTGRAAPTVAILGHVGKHNMGDEAIVEALIAGLRRDVEPVNIIAFTMNPADTIERHGVVTYPIRPNAGPLEPEAPPEPADVSPAVKWRRRLRRIGPIRWLVKGARAVAQAITAVIVECRFDIASYSCLKGADLVIVAGSAQVADFFGGPVGYPWALLRWTVLGRLAGARVAFMSTGCGPVNYRLSRWFLGRALRLSEYRSFRDPSSLQLARVIGSPEPSRLVRDLAFSLPGLRIAEAPPRRVRPLVGVNALPYCSGSYWYVVDEARHQHYLQVHADAIVQMVERGFDVAVFSTQTSDPKISRQIAERVGRLSPAALAHVRVEPFVPTVTHLLAIIRSCDVVVATRYHGLLLSIAQGVPVIGVSYHPKTRDLLDAVGLRDFCVEVDAIEPGRLAAMVERAWASNPELRRRIVHCLPALTAEVNAQYADIVALLTFVVESRGRAATAGGSALEWQLPHPRRRTHKSRAS